MRTLLLALLQGAAAASTVQEALLSAYTPVAAGAGGGSEAQAGAVGVHDDAGAPAAPVGS